MKLVLAATLAALLAGGAAQAQAPGPVMGDDNLPSCSRTVTDHCIQRGEGMKAAPAMHRPAATRHHPRQAAMKRHYHHRTVKHTMARKHARHAAKSAAHAMAPVKPKG